MAHLSLWKFCICTVAAAVSRGLLSTAVYLRMATPSKHMNSLADDEIRLHVPLKLSLHWTRWKLLSAPLTGSTWARLICPAGVANCAASVRTMVLALGR